MNWSKLHTIASVDYLSSNDAFDMLQAAVALPPDLIVQPDELTFMIDETAPVSPTVELRLRAPAALQWTAEETLSWLDVTPTSDYIPNSPLVSIYSNELAPGWQQGEIAFSAGNNGVQQYSKSVSVKAYLGKVERTFLPTISR